MHAEPARRYASVDLLREDLERHLQNRPVSAHPGGVFYRTRKFITRHRMAVAACVLVVMSLAAGATVTLVQASRARAREEAAVAEAAMRTKYELAMALHHKGDIAQAQIYFREAAEHGRRMPQFVNTTRVDSVLQLARLLHLFERDPAAAEPLYREAVGLARALKPGDHEELASALNEHAQVLLGLDRPRRRGSAGREALAMWRRLDGGNVRRRPRERADAGGHLQPPRQGRRSGEALSRSARARSGRVPRASLQLDRPPRRTGRLPGKARQIQRSGAAASGGAAECGDALRREASRWRRVRSRAWAIITWRRVRSRKRRASTGAR